MNGAPQEVEVLDAEGDAAFTGPMADKARKGHVGSPMPGAVDKVRWGGVVGEGCGVWGGM